MASDLIIQEIKQRLDLVTYIGRTVNLKRAGSTFKALCPFHAEKTPSFFVFPHTSTWHCFGSCNEGGDIFSFLQKQEGLSFREALHVLAGEAGLALEEEDEQRQIERKEQQRLLALCEVALLQFQEWLWEHPESEYCRDYIAGRGLKIETVHRFGLGFAPNSWDSLLMTLAERGYALDDMVRVGLARRREMGHYYDVFRARLIFPIRDVRGRVVGFGGRALYAEQTPKYLNSPQGILFDKSALLYGLDLAKERIRTASRAVVVEGYMDVLAAHQANFTNVVASLGTALTEAQLRLLTRYSPNLTLALDGDQAGQKAAQRGLEAVLKLQTQWEKTQREEAKRGRSHARYVESDIRVVALPDGLDPCDLIMSAPDKWAQRVAGALPLMDYMIAHRLRGVDLQDAVEKARAASDLLPLIADLESNVIRNHYLQRLALLLGTDERSLLLEMPASKEDSRSSRPRHEPPPSLPPDPNWESPPPDVAGEYVPPPWEAEGVSTPQKREQAEWREVQNELPALPNPASLPSLESYLLFLLLERPSFVGEATRCGVRSDMWVEVAHRQIWEQLCHEPPVSSTHLREWLADLDELVVESTGKIIEFYSSYPAIKNEEWEAEAFNRLDDFLMRYEERQARNLQLILNGYQVDSESDRQLVRQLHQQIYVVTKNRLVRQKAWRARNGKR